MTSRAPTFSNADHKKLDIYFLKLMEAVRDGVLTPAAAQGDVMQLLAAVDIGNYTEPLARASEPDHAIALLARHS